jgi:hypothetical protein
LFFSAISLVLKCSSSLLDNFSTGRFTVFFTGFLADFLDGFFAVFFLADFFICPPVRSYDLLKRGVNIDKEHGHINSKTLLKNSPRGG